MTPEEIDYMLNAGCPGCSNDAIRTEDLCEHDDPLHGPMCPTCCSKLHFGMAAA